MVLPRTPTIPRWLFTAPLGGGAGTVYFSVGDHLLASERGVVLVEYELYYL